MEAARIQARAVIKVAAISLAVIAVAALLVIVVLHVRTTLRWLFASVFHTLALQVVPPIIREFEELGAKVPGYVQDFRHWANQNPQFRFWAPFIAWSSGVGIGCASERRSRGVCGPLLARLQVGAEEFSRLRL